MNELSELGIDIEGGEPVGAMPPDDEQIAVVDFHRQAGLSVAQVPSLPSQEDAALRARLILEEAVEFANAVGLTPTVSEDGTITLTPNGKDANLVDAIDALTDELYVTYGAGVTFGTYLKPIFFEVHRSNMTKLNGEVVRRADGKIEKPAEGYEPPQIQQILDYQREYVEQFLQAMEEMKALFASLSGDKPETAAA